MCLSKSVLKGARDWSAFVTFIPDFEGKEVLELGLGYGCHCKYAVEQVADHVLGLDLSYKMLETAKQKNSASFGVVNPHILIFIIYNPFYAYKIIFF